ncbi:MAG: hypothetical protein MJ146_05370 [Clostridia bacterium]|nr:hypothetical protein [Clostridia bacterium]
MKKNIKVSILVILALVIVFAVVKIRMIDDAPLQAEDDEIKVNIRLDLDEDIGLFLISYDVNGAEGSGGVSNADHSMLKKDSKDLYWSFYKEQLETDADAADVKLSFTVVTDYFEPNYDNNYPEEYTIPMDAISFHANFGEIYYVTIKGSKVNGYQVFIGES